MNWWRAIRVMYARHRQLLNVKHVKKIANKYPSCPAGDIARTVARINEERAREY